MQEILQQLRELKEDSKARHQETQKAIERLRSEMIEQFAMVDKRLNLVEKRLDKLEDKVDRLEDKLDNKIYKVEDKVTNASWHNQILTGSVVSIALAVIYSVLK